MIFEYTKNGVFLRRFLVFLFCAVFSIFLQRYLIFLVVFSMFFVISTFLKTIIFCCCVSLVVFLVSFYKIWGIQFRCFFSLSRYWRLFPWLFAFSDLKKAFPILTFFFHFPEIDVFFFKIFAWFFVVAFFMFYFLKFNFVSFRFTNTGVFFRVFMGLFWFFVFVVLFCYFLRHVLIFLLVNGFCYLRGEGCCDLLIKGDRFSLQNFWAVFCCCVFQALFFENDFCFLQIYKYWRFFRVFLGVCLDAFLFFFVFVVLFCYFLRHVLIFLVVFLNSFCYLRNFKLHLLFFCVCQRAFLGLISFFFFSFWRCIFLFFYKVFLVHFKVRRVLRSAN